MTDRFVPDKPDSATDPIAEDDHRGHLCDAMAYAFAGVDFGRGDRASVWTQKITPPDVVNGLVAALEASEREMKRMLPFLTEVEEDLVKAAIAQAGAAIQRYRGG